MLSAVKALPGKIYSAVFPKMQETITAGEVGFKYGYPTPGEQHPRGEMVMENVFFLSKSQWDEALHNQKYDLIIVGSGICGYAVAQKALENDANCRILMLERGPFFLPEHFQNLPLPYMHTLGGFSETFPWTLATDTATGKLGTVRWQHGMVPFFGGRSTLWSAWCPRPTQDEMHGWPKQTIETAGHYFESAEKLLHVQQVDNVDSPKADGLCKVITDLRPVYGQLQQKVQGLLKEAVDARKIHGVYRTEPAPIACDGKHVNGVDFEKFSVPGELLGLQKRQQERSKQGTGASLDIVNNCVVEKILQQDGLATALQTSKGDVPVLDAKLILAMGTLPPTTLIRNSFPLQAKKVGKRFSAHFISAITARVPREDLESDPFEDLEIAACYIAGIGKDYSQQFHIQLSVISDKNPEKNAGKALRYMPDVVATASEEQLQSSPDHVIFVCAVLGELNALNAGNSFLHHDGDGDLTTNSILRIVSNDEKDRKTWNAMDEATFQILEGTLSPRGAERVEYWHGSPDTGTWEKSRPDEQKRRVDALVHESSTLHLGTGADAPVGLDYKLRHSKNVYITGGGLWPLGGSWNPTMTMVALAQHLTDQLVEKK